MLILLLKSIIIGAGATLVFDLWAQVFKITFKVTPSNICMVGRWILYMPDGVFKHANITNLPKKKGECAAGWITHYMTGVSLSLIFLLIAGREWLAEPTILPALIFGILSVAAPLFIMQPAFGFGFAASKTPNPMQSRLRSIMNHAAFGVGIYLFAVLIKVVL